MDEEYADDSDYDEATADALDTATRLFAEPTEEEQALLKRMKDWAKRAGVSKIEGKTTGGWLDRHPRPRGKWSKNESLSSPNTGPRRIGYKKSWP